jgi:elongation factor G
MDIVGADFYHVLDMVHDRLKCNAVPIQLPVGKESEFRASWTCGDEGGYLL